MYLSNIEVSGIRNLSGNLKGKPGLNFIFGQNGQGKTSWLEAIYILGTTKSFRTSRVNEIITFNTPTMHLKAIVTNDDSSKILEFHFDGSKKYLFLNNKRVTTADYLGQLGIFIYSQEEMSVIRGEPVERRSFIDRGVLSLKPGYIQTLSNYNRNLKQKNALLKSIEDSKILSSQFIDLLETWNNQLVISGTDLHKARIEYVSLLNKVLERNLFSQDLLAVNYLSSLEKYGDLQYYSKLFTERLKVRRGAEIEARHSLIGPHRDDLEILVNGQKASNYASAGQQRSALLTLELAQLSIYRENHGVDPIFLLDDVDAELDVDRIKTFLNIIEGKAQVFITTSKQTIAKEYESRAYLQEIINGSAVEDGLYIDSKI